MGVSISRSAKVRNGSVNLGVVHLNSVAPWEEAPNFAGTSNDVLGVFRLRSLAASAIVLTIALHRCAIGRAFPSGLWVRLRARSGGFVYIHVCHLLGGGVSCAQWVVSGTALEFVVGWTRGRRNRPNAPSDPSITRAQANGTPGSYIKHQNEPNYDARSTWHVPVSFRVHMTPMAYPIVLLGCAYLNYTRVQTTHFNDLPCTKFVLRLRTPFTCASSVPRAL